MPVFVGVLLGVILRPISGHSDPPAPADLGCPKVSVHCVGARRAPQGMDNASIFAMIVAADISGPASDPPGPSTQMENVGGPSERHDSAAVVHWTFTALNCAAQSRPWSSRRAC
jgi:hypothetical protein